MKRTNTVWHSNTFSFPGGKHDGKENLITAVLREVKEELDISCDPEKVELGTVIHYYDSSDEFESLKFYFVCDNYEGEIKNLEPHKHDNLKFYPVNDLPEDILAHSRLALNQTLKGIPFTSTGWEE